MKLKKIMDPDMLLYIGLLLGSVGGALFIGDILSGVVAAVPAGLGSLLVAVGSAMKIFNELK